MDSSTRNSNLIIASLVLIFGIIHLSVASTIVSKYRHYDDIFQQPRILSIFNIVIGSYGIILGIIGICAVQQENYRLGKNAGIAAGILGIFALVSLITSLVINADSINYIQNHLLSRINSYIESEHSMLIVDFIQSKHQCCGVHLWFDWVSIALAKNFGRADMGIILLDQKNNSLIHTFENSTRENLWRPLNRINSFGSVFSATVNLPRSCCKSTVATGSQSSASYCVFHTSNGTRNIYLDGCIAQVANIAVFQVMGIAIMNTCMVIIAFVLLQVLSKTFSDSSEKKNEHFQPAPIMPMHYQNALYYNPPYDPNASYQQQINPTFAQYRW